MEDMLGLHREKVNKSKFIFFIFPVFFSISLYMAKDNNKLNLEDNYKIQNLKLSI